MYGYAWKTWEFSEVTVVTAEDLVLVVSPALYVISFLNLRAGVSKRPSPSKHTFYVAIMGYISSGIETTGLATIHFMV